MLTLTVILLMSAAIIPALLGTLFWLSLGLNSKFGETSCDHTFVRPAWDGLAIMGRQVSPLLISSISSTVMYVVSRIIGNCSLRN